MKNKHKNKRIIVKIVSVFMLVLITALAICVPCNALVLVNDGGSFKDKSTFPMNVSMVYDLGSSTSVDTAVNPYSISLNVGNFGDLEDNSDGIEFNTLGFDRTCTVKYDVENDEYWQNLFFGSDNGESYVKLGTKRCEILGYANENAYGYPQDILQKVRFSADTIYYNTALILYSQSVGGSQEHYYLGLPYLELQTPKNNYSMKNDYVYTCSFDVTTNYGLREHIEYTKEWRGAWLDDSDILYLIDPDEIRKYSGVETIAIENFVGELTYTILTETVDSVGTTTPYGCWELDESITNSELDGVIIGGEFMLGTEPIYDRTVVGVKYFSELSFTSGHKVVAGYNGGQHIKDLYNMYYLNDNSERYLYVSKVTKESNESVLLEWLEKHATVVTQNDIGDTTYQKANIMSSNFDYGTQTVMLCLPMYDTSHVSSFDDLYNFDYQRRYSYPDFDKFITTYNYRCVDNNYEDIEFSDISFTNWLGKAVGSFFSLEIFPNFSLGGLLSILVSFSLVLILLRWIGG